MTAPTVRPAVAVTAWDERDWAQDETFVRAVSGRIASRLPTDRLATLVDGLPDQIAARVRDVIGTWALFTDGPDKLLVKDVQEVTARVLATLGITTEARDG